MNGLFTRLEPTDQTGMVLDLPVFSWPHGMVQGANQLRSIAGSTLGHVSVASNYLSSKGKKLSTTSLSVRRIILGKVAGLGPVVFGTVGPNADNRQQFQSEVIVDLRPPEHYYGQVFEVTEESLRKYIDHLTDEKKDALDFEYHFYPCAVCGLECLAEPAGSFSYCFACGWEDEGYGLTYELSPNHMTLKEAKKLLRETGQLKNWRGPYAEQVTVWNKIIADRSYAIDDGRGGWGRPLEVCLRKDQP